MAEPARAFFERLIDEVFNRRNPDAAESMLHPDYVEEYPQSGERIRGIANYKAVYANIPGRENMDQQRVDFFAADDQWVLTPTYTLVRVDGTGEAFTAVSRARYPDGSIWHIVALVRMRDGKMWRNTVYFGAEFEAPAWRAPWVERDARPNG